MVLSEESILTFRIILLNIPQHEIFQHCNLLEYSVLCRTRKFLDDPFLLVVYEKSEEIEMKSILLLKKRIEVSFPMNIKEKKSERDFMNPCGANLSITKP